MGAPFSVSFQEVSDHPLAALFFHPLIGYIGIDSEQLREILSFDGEVIYAQEIDCDRRGGRGSKGRS